MGVQNAFDVYDIWNLYNWIHRKNRYDSIQHYCSINTNVRHTPTYQINTHTAAQQHNSTLTRPHTYQHSNTPTRRHALHAGRGCNELGDKRLQSTSIFHVGADQTLTQTLNPNPLGSSRSAGVVARARSVFWWRSKKKRSRWPIGQPRRMRKHIRRETRCIPVLHLKAGLTHRRRNTPPHQRTR